VTSLMEYDIIPILTLFLFENIPGVADQAIWAVGNLAGDSPVLRDKLINQGGVDAVIHFINNTEHRNNLIQAVWALSNLCRGNPLPEY
jgi:importin subunit alpha-1